MNPLLDFPPEGPVTTAARTVIRFTGTRVCLDQETVEDIRHQLLDLADTPGAPELILDFENIEYVASLALGTLVMLHKRLAAAGRRLTVRNVRPLVREVFATTRLDRLLNLQPGRRTGDAPPTQYPDDTPLGVLVVDDDEQALRDLGAALRDRGYRVWLATHGHQAVELFRRHWREIALVLLDALMRGMDGPDTLAAMRRVSSSVRCCLTIGRSDAYTKSLLLRLGAIHVFRKPFAVAEVTEKLDQLARRSCRPGEVRWIEIPNRGE